MASSIAGPIIGLAPVVGPSFAAAGCANRVADAPAGLPEGWPRILDEAMAWTGNQFADELDYIHTLSESDLQEAENALRVFKALGLDGDLVSRDNFPLPTLGPRLDEIRRDVHDGKGFGVIRGLDPHKYSIEDLTVMYLGIQSYIANRHGRQDRKGNMLVHIVADNSSKLKAGHHRHSTSPIEAGDVVSWLTRSTAASGGKCIIASAYTVYNVLAASRPDMIRTLARSDWPFAIPRFQCRPVLFHHEGRVIMNFGRVALTGNAVHPRPANLPTVTPRQMEALDAIEAIAKAAQLEISTQAGDIHFINNLAVLHRREGFVNGEAPRERRHLVRMRLRDDDLGWELPADLRQEWSAAFNQKAPKIWHLEPMPDGFFPLRSQAN
ncbi:TauD domain-containing protein [Fusarium falciforme]|nr:TauD domain-containing protein [Fusarium falciforme]WAO83780.1 TauD domain-containing protein [Fusarium falciforme]